MEILIHEINNKKIVELISDDIIIRETQDALDLMAESHIMGSGAIILMEKHLSPRFFDLKSCLAGEILQKFSNYSFKLAVIGDFSVYNSKSLADFIRESNKGNSIFFVDSHETAMYKLSGKLFNKD